MPPTTVTSTVNPAMIPAALRAVRVVPRSPLLREDRPALVVAQAPADLEVARREALAAESRAAGKRDRGGIAGLDVGFDAVQAERQERVAQDQSDPRPHVSVA